MNPRLSLEWLRYLASVGARQDDDGWRWKIDPSMRFGGFGPWRPEWTMLRLPGLADAVPRHPRQRARGDGLGHGARACAPVPAARRALRDPRRRRPLRAHRAAATRSPRWCSTSSGATDGRVTRRSTHNRIKLALHHLRETATGAAAAAAPRSRRARPRRPCRRGSTPGRGRWPPSTSPATASRRSRRRRLHAEILLADADVALAELGEATVVGRGLGAYIALHARRGPRRPHVLRGDPRRRARPRRRADGPDVAELLRPAPRDQVRPTLRPVRAVPRPAPARLRGGVRPPGRRPARRSTSRSRCRRCSSRRGWRPSPTSPASPTARSAPRLDPLRRGRREPVRSLEDRSAHEPRRHARRRGGGRGVRRDGAGHRGDPPVRDARRRHARSTAATTAATHRGWEANDAFPVMFAAVVCVGLWIGFHAPRARRPRPDRRRRHGLRRGLRARARRLHPPPAALVRRPPSAVLERLAAAHGCTTASAGRPTGCWCRSCRRPSGPGRQPPSGSRPSHVPDAP